MQQQQQQQQEEEAVLLGQAWLHHNLVSVSC
jgi:hypothetical protein